MDYVAQKELYCPVTKKILRTPRREVKINRNGTTLYRNLLFVYMYDDYERNGKLIIESHEHGLRKTILNIKPGAVIDFDFRTDIEDIFPKFRDMHYENISMSDKPIEIRQIKITPQ